MEKKSTEQQIKEAAKKLFFIDGVIHATTQEIADAAGVNRTLLNYYFRSRDELFQQVFLEARQEIHDKVNEIFVLKKPFEEKVKAFVEEFSSMLQGQPYAEIFMISEINDPRKDYPLISTKRRGIHSFLKEIEAEMEKGTIRKMEPLSFLMNMFALISHPFLLRPLYHEVFKIDPDDYTRILERRKETIIQLILSK